MRAPLVTSLIIVAILLGACGSDDGESFATDPGTRFEVEPGEGFSVVMDSNPSTGYAWALAEPLPRDVVRLVEDRYVPPDDDLVGSAGRQELSFEAVGDGSTYIQLWSVRSFDDPPEPVDRAQFEVIVGSGVPEGADDQGDGDRPLPPIPDDEDALMVGEVVAGNPVGEIVVRGSLFDGGTGLVLCDALAESFPPQCPDDSLALANPDAIDAVLQSAGGVQWSDRPFTLLGELTPDGFQVTAFQAG